MKLKIATKIIHLANWIMDYIPKVGYPIGCWMKDWKIVEPYYRREDI